MQKPRRHADGPILDISYMHLEGAVLLEDDPQVAGFQKVVDSLLSSSERSQVSTSERSEQSSSERSELDCWECSQQDCSEC